MMTVSLRQIILGFLLISFLGLTIYLNTFTTVSVSFSPFFLFLVYIAYVVRNKLFHYFSLFLIVFTQFLLLPIDRFFIVSISLLGIYYFLYQVKIKAEKYDNLNGSIMRIYHSLMIVRKWKESLLYSSFSKGMKDDLDALEDHLGNLSTATLTWRQLKDLQDEYRRKSIETGEESKGSKPSE